WFLIDLHKFPNFSSFFFAQEQSFLKAWGGAGGGVHFSYLGKNKVAYCFLLLKYWQNPSFICLTHLLGQGSTKFFLTFLKVFPTLFLISKNMGLYYADYAFSNFVIYVVEGL
ncbi:hypothetical protein ACJX0J_027603, partial [Zea mays]